MTITLTASNLVSMLESLPKGQFFNYAHSKTGTQILIETIKKPEGPVTIKRWNPSKGEKFQDAKIEKISSIMLWRLAGAIRPNHPVNVDRVFGGSYNTRSALEALLLHTENFFLCYPGRLERVGKETIVKDGHKHLVYCPDDTHRAGVIKEKELSDTVIAEVDRELKFDGLQVKFKSSDKFEIEIERRHAQIQFMLIKIAEHLDMQTWVAKNDHSIVSDGVKFIEFSSTVKSLNEVAALNSYRSACDAGELIDCIWFSNDGRKIPAVIEIEHSTGITSGLTRMKGFKGEAPELKHMTFIIAAPDELRGQVFKKSSVSQFKDLDIKYLSYTAIEDLYYLVIKYSINGVVPEAFIHTFLEPVDTSKS